MKTLIAFLAGIAIATATGAIAQTVSSASVTVSCNSDGSIAVQVKKP